MSIKNNIKYPLALVTVKISIIHLIDFINKLWASGVVRAFTGKSVITIINITFNINIIFRLHTPTTRRTIQIVVFSGSVNSILLTSWEKSRQVSKIIKKLISLKQHICIFVNIIANMTMCLSVCSCFKYLVLFVS